MGLVQKHAILTAVGLILSVLAIAWLQPNETGGTTLVVVFSVDCGQCRRRDLYSYRPNSGRVDGASKKY